MYSQVLMKGVQQVLGTFFETIVKSIVEYLVIAGLVFLIVDFDFSTFSAESLLRIVHKAN